MQSIGFNGSSCFNTDSNGKLQLNIVRDSVSESNKAQNILKTYEGEYLFNSSLGIPWKAILDENFNGTILIQSVIKSKLQQASIRYKDISINFNNATRELDYNILVAENTQSILGGLSVNLQS